MLDDPRPLLKVALLISLVGLFYFFSGKKRVLDLIALDLRSLALFRILLGLVIVADVIDRGRDLQAHYTDWGVLPRSVMIDYFGVEWYWSLHLASGTMFWQAVLFITQALFAVLLIIGVRTRLATVVSWILLFSVQARNPLVLQGGDTVLRLLLFWAMFLPLGARFSVDSNGDKSPGRTASVVSAAFMIQLAIIYWFNAIMKNSSVWWKDGSAVYYTLAIDQMVTEFGIWMRQFHGLLKVISFSTAWWETLGPFLLFIPFFHRQFRIVAMMGFIFFHLGINACIEIGLFSYIMITAWIPLYPWKNRSADGGAPEQPCKEEALLNPSRLCQIFAGFCLVYVILWNVRTLEFSDRRYVLPHWTDWIGYSLGINQTWNMFSPRPLYEDGWYVIPAQTKQGREIGDIFRDGAPVTWEKPAVGSRLYKNQRWQKYVMNLWLPGQISQRQYYGKYLCRKWMDTKGVETFQIHFMKEVTTDTGETPPENLVLWEHKCH